MNQNLTPLADALLKQTNETIESFDVPGHKGDFDALVEYFGSKCVSLDKNSRESIDYLCRPRGVIFEAEQLAAEAFGAKEAFFMVGGTTAAIHAMVMCACAPGDKIILPRNVHYSVINAVILSGAIPIYIEPKVHPVLGIALGICIEDLEVCIRQNTDAKAVFVNNPTYYGVCSDMRKIVEIAHAYQMYVLADEAHGTHFYFSDKLPEAAMHCRADLSAVSMHKTGGSFTQSSLLLSSGSIDKDYIFDVINLTCTTSASYLLMASLDIARRNLAVNGKTLISKTIETVEETRKKINEIDGFYAFSEEIIDGESVYDFDITKLSVNTRVAGFTGIEVYTKLRDEYQIQLEFGDVCNFLAICTFADKISSHYKLIDALRDISLQKGESDKIPEYEYISPIIKLSPRKAFYSKKKIIPVIESENRIASCAVMSYPPGIPLLAPGELITRKIIDHILLSSQKGCSVSGIDEEMRIFVVD